MKMKTSCILSAPRRRLSAPALRLAALFALLLGASSPATAHVTMLLDPDGKAAAKGRSVLQGDRIEVLLLGSDHFDVREVRPRSLRLGNDAGGGAAFIRSGFRVKDANGDGYPDLFARFPTGRTGLTDGEDAFAYLRGKMKSGSLFTAVSPLGGSIDNCTPVSDDNDASDIVGATCTFSTSQEPLDVNALVAGLNSSLAGLTNKTIGRASAVVIEAWGGDGHSGSNTDKTSCHSGKGGDGGYSRTVQSLNDLDGLLADGTSLYLYVAQKGPDGQQGGSSSLVVGKAVTSVGDIVAPASEAVLVIAGGGGGGGRHDDDGTTGDCDNGFDGGDGGTAIASTSADASTAGGDGSNKHKGRGGNADGNGSGGPNNNNGDAGEDGIGGLGSKSSANDDRTPWQGSSVTSWLNGSGGKGGDGGKAGGGGGGFGGGGGGQSKGARGGGGGGGSWARQSGIAESSLNDALIVGAGDTPDSPVVVVTFQAL